MTKLFNYWCLLFIITGVDNSIRGLIICLVLLSFVGLVNAAIYPENFVLNNALFEDKQLFYKPGDNLLIKTSYSCTNRGYVYHPLDLELEDGSYALSCGDPSSHGHTCTNKLVSRMYYYPQWCDGSTHDLIINYQIPVNNKAGEYEVIIGNWEGSGTDTLITWHQGREVGTITITSTVNRGSYSFTAYTSYQESQLKDFLGLPDDLDIDSYLNSLSDSSLDAWTDYWVNFWISLNLPNSDELVSFTQAKHDEYYSGSGSCEPPDDSYYCFNNYIWWYDACGELTSIKDRCAYGCSGTNCNPEPESDCTSQAYALCYNNKLYWFNSCHQPESIKEDCSGICDVDECVGESGNCISHYRERCYNNLLYWYNSCDYREDLIKTCPEQCEFDHCVSGEPEPCSTECLTNCPSGWGCRGHSCYKEVNGDWASVKSQCNSMNAHLITINDRCENEWAASQADDNWIGYNDILREGSWTWDYGDSDFFDWLPGEPNNAGNEDCAIQSHLYKWSDGTCSDVRDALCELEDPCSDCNDNNACTIDYCGTNGCVNNMLYPCKGNGLCESGEDYCNAPVDCPKPTCGACQEYVCGQGCVMLSDCCGNGLCEYNENCDNCAKDCGCALSIDLNSVDCLVNAEQECHSVNKITTEDEIYTNFFLLTESDRGIEDVELTFKSNGKAIGTIYANSPLVTYSFTLPEGRQNVEVYAYDARYNESDDKVIFSILIGEQETHNNSIWPFHAQEGESSSTSNSETVNNLPVYFGGSDFYLMLSVVAASITYLSIKKLNYRFASYSWVNKRGVFEVVTPEGTFYMSESEFILYRIKKYNEKWSDQDNYFVEEKVKEYKRKIMQWLSYANKVTKRLGINNPYHQSRAQILIDFEALAKNYFLLEREFFMQNLPTNSTIMPGTITREQVELSKEKYEAYLKFINESQPDMRAEVESLRLLYYRRKTSLEELMDKVLFGKDFIKGFIFGSDDNSNSGVMAGDFASGMCMYGDVRDVVIYELSRAGLIKHEADELIFGLALFGLLSEFVEPVDLAAAGLKGLWKKLPKPVKEFWLKFLKKLMKSGLTMINFGKKLARVPPKFLKLFFEGAGKLLSDLPASKFDDLIDAFNNLIKYGDEFVTRLLNKIDNFADFAKVSKYADEVGDDAFKIVIKRLDEGELMKLTNYNTIAHITDSVSIRNSFEWVTRNGDEIDDAFAAVAKKYRMDANYIVEEYKGYVGCYFPDDSSIRFNRYLMNEENSYFIALHEFTHKASDYGVIVKGFDDPKKAYTKLFNDQLGDLNHYYKGLDGSYLENQFHDTVANKLMLTNKNADFDKWYDQWLNSNKYNLNLLDGGKEAINIIRDNKEELLPQLAEMKVMFDSVDVEKAVKVQELIDKVKKTDFSLGNEFETIYEVYSDISQKVKWK